MAKKRIFGLWLPLVGAVATIAAWALFTGAVAKPAISTPASAGYEEAADYETATVLWVSDGDTIFVRTESGEENYVRFLTCDAPESVNPDESRNTPEGEAASEFTKALLPKGTTVWLARDVSDTDKYGRWLRFVWLEVPDDAWDIDEVRTKMANAIIIDTGHAVAKSYTPDTSYYRLFKEIEDSR